MQNRRQKTTAGWVSANVLVWLLAGLTCLPLYFVLVSSLKSSTEIYSGGFALPLQPMWENFALAWTQADLGAALRNSIVITISAEVLSLALAIPAAYAIARSHGRIAKLVEQSFGLGFLIPTFAALVPTVLLAINIGLFHNPLFLILLFAGSVQPLSVILLTQFMRAVPVEMEEAAMVDGASRLRLLWSVYMPLVRPGIATIAVLNFLTIWNEFLYSNVILGASTAVRTIQVALPSLQMQTNFQLGVLMAGTVICSIPTILLYIVLQRRMTDALTQGAVKA